MYISSTTRYFFTLQSRSSQRADHIPAPSSECWAACTTERWYKKYALFVLAVRAKVTEIVSRCCAPVRSMRYKCIPTAMYAFNSIRTFNFNEKCESVSGAASIDAWIVREVSALVILSGMRLTLNGLRLGTLILNMWYVALSGIVYVLEPLSVNTDHIYDVRFCTWNRVAVCRIIECTKKATMEHAAANRHFLARLFVCRSLLLRFSVSLWLPRCICSCHNHWPFRSHENRQNCTHNHAGAGKMAYCFGQINFDAWYQEAIWPFGNGNWSRLSLA